MKPIRIPLYLSAAAYAMLSLTACNTVEGVGEDFKAAGQVIKETADDTKRKIQK